MKITEVRIRKIENMEALKADAQVVFDDVFVIKGIKVIESNENTFIAMPDKKDKAGRYHEVCHPIRKEFREELSDAILAKYFEEVSEVKEDVITE